VRESAQSWRELLLDLKRRGLAIGPELAVADGALGFWQAVEEVWPKTRGQRCWVHKTANVLNKLPKSQQAKAKRARSDPSRCGAVGRQRGTNRFGKVAPWRALRLAAR
jgi:transposase-like protein